MLKKSATVGCLLQIMISSKDKVPLARYRCAGMTGSHSKLKHQLIARSGMYVDR